MSSRAERIALLFPTLLLGMGLLWALHPENALAQARSKKLVVAIGEDLSSTDPSAAFGILCRQEIAAVELHSFQTLKIQFELLLVKDITIR